MAEDPQKRSFSLSKLLFVISLCVISFGYGYVTFASGCFPNTLITETLVFIDEYINRSELPEYLSKTDYIVKVPVHSEEYAYKSLSLVTSATKDRKLAATIIDMDGKVVHEWEIDWFEIWPDPTHIPRSDVIFPKSRPGTHIHGAVVLENGDLIFNFEYLGMVRLDVCGNVIWRLPYRTHHSIYLDEYGYLWASGRIHHEDPLPNLPSHIPPFDEPTILKVSQDGEILQEISVFDVLQANGLEGFLTLSSISERDVTVSDDTLHLNDVETFPSYLEEGVFQAGDIMISLRNINTILVFREEGLKVTNISTGTFVRQHDPDFIDGNTISLFDNYNIAPEEFGHQSRIMIESFADGNRSVHFTGSEEKPFYTDIMGKHQWLPNGNLLITESMKGRAFEIDPQGVIVWEYINIVDEGIAGMVDEVQRLPERFTEEYIHQLIARCGIEEQD